MAGERNWMTLSLVAIDVLRARAARARGCGHFFQKNI
jgi:hypothetical protein